MGLASSLRRVARSADPHVFCVAGPDSRDEARSLRLEDSIQLATTPRAANILLIVGDLDEGLVSPALVAHDALAAPRASVWWRGGVGGDLVRANFPEATVVDDHPVETLREVHEQLLSGSMDGESPLLPDVEPHRWRGIGPYGQGGKGMTGGVPYGRPLPARAEDRDGLKLDQLVVRIGPLFPAFPIGLALDVRLQGDVVQDAVIESFTDRVDDFTSPFHQALRRPLPVRDLELARARSHLLWLSDAVAVAGAAALSERILRFAQHVEPGDDGEVGALERSLRRRGFLGWTTRGVGAIHPQLAEGVTGPVRRAAGSPVDTRNDDAAYRDLGFEPVVQQSGDCRARWLQRIREAAQSLQIADRAADARTGGDGAIESPRGVLSAGAAPSTAVAGLVPAAIRGMEWGDAVTTIVSLDLDASELHTAAAREGSFG